MKMKHTMGLRCHGRLETKGEGVERHVLLDGDRFATVTKTARGEKGTGFLVVFKQGVWTIWDQPLDTDAQMFATERGAMKAIAWDAHMVLGPAGVNLRASAA